MSNIYGLNSIGSGRRNPNSTSGYRDIEAGQNRSSNQNGERSCMNSMFPSFKIKSFCFTIIVINTLIYLVEFTISKASTNYEWNCILYDFGAKYTPAIKHEFHIHRLFLPIFLHGSFTHVLMNNISIFFLGFFIESFLGLFKTIILYFTCGIYALFLSSIIDTENLSVGASGSIMGFSGFFILFYIIYWRNIGESEKRFFVIFVVILLMNLFPKGQNIDMFAHMGGFITGSLVSILLIGIEKLKHDDQIPMFKKARTISFVLLLTFLIVYIGLISFMEIGVNNLGYLCKSISQLNQKTIRIK